MYTTQCWISGTRDEAQIHTWANKLCKGVGIQRTGKTYIQNTIHTEDFSVENWDTGRQHLARQGLYPWQVQRGQA